MWFGLSARDGRISSPPASCCTDASKLAEVPAATTACSGVTAPAALIRLPRYCRFPPGPQRMEMGCPSWITGGGATAGYS